MLPEHGADISAQDDHGMTLEVFATARGRLRIAAMLQAEPVRREEVRKSRCVAFALEQHQWLGIESWVQELKGGVVRMALEPV